MKQKNWYLRLGSVLTALSFAYILLGFFWTPYDPGLLSAPDRFAKPSGVHLFGCDQLGRDVFSRTLEGAGSTLLIALAVVAVGFAVGLLVGALCGYFGGPLDAVAMRLCDAITAFPSILLAMVIIAITGAGTYNVILALGILFIPSFARLVRGEFRKFRQREFVEAALATGISPIRIVFRHILPNTWPVLLSGLTIGFNNAVLSEASMSFLGIGVGPAEASLGRMLSEGQGILFSAPWCTAFPALVVILMILGVGMLGEGIRENLRRSNAELTF